MYVSSGFININGVKNVDDSTELLTLTNGVVIFANIQRKVLSG